MLPVLTKRRLDTLYSNWTQALFERSTTGWVGGTIYSVVHRRRERNKEAEKGAETNQRVTNVHTLYLHVNFQYRLT